MLYYQCYGTGEWSPAPGNLFYAQAGAQNNAPLPLGNPDQRGRRIGVATDTQPPLMDQPFLPLKHKLESLPAAEACEELFDLPPQSRAIVFRLLSKDHAIAVFEKLEPHQQQALIENLRNDEALHILEEMSADDRVRLLDEMPAKVAKQLLASLTPGERESTSLLLGYAPETAGRIMVPDFVSLQEGMTVAEALTKIRRVGLDRETIYTMYVTDQERRLQGVVSLRELVLANLADKVKDIARPEIISARTDTDQEQVARLIEAHDLLAVPIVDMENRLVGIVTVDDALDILDDEATEDFHRLGGVTVAATGDDLYFHLNPWQQTRRRLPWLMTLALAGIISGSLISAFENALTTIVALAFFIPMIMDTAGNVGAQAVTLVVRALATGEVQARHFWRTLLREMGTGALLGLGVGAAGGIVAMIVTQDHLIAFSITGALIGTVLAAGGLGTALPFILTKMRLDPAVASAPLITTIGDGIGLFIYFSLAKLLYNL